MLLKDFQKYMFWKASTLLASVSMTWFVYFTCSSVQFSRQKMLGSPMDSLKVGACIWGQTVVLVEGDLYLFYVFA